MRSKCVTIKSANRSQSERFKTSEKKDEIIDQQTAPGPTPEYGTKKELMVVKLTDGHLEEDEVLV